MNPYRKIPGEPRRLPSRLRKTTLLAFGLGLTAGVGLGPVAAVLALRSASTSEPAAVTIPISGIPEQVAPTAPDPPVKEAEAPTPERSRMTSAQARATIAGQADRVMKALRARDTRALAAMIDEDEGLELNPFSQGSDFPQLTVEEVRGCFQDRTVRVWGDRGGEGGNVSLSCAAYWKSYIGDVDLGAPSDVTYNEMHGGELDQASQLGVAVDDIFVRYAFPDANGPGKVLTLVFTTKGRAWKLGAIAHQGPESVDRSDG